MSGSYRVAALVLRRASARTPLHHVSFPHLFNGRQAGVVYSGVRAYATPGRPKKAVGEASKPVKRTAKKTTTTTKASSKSTGTKGAAKKKKTTKAKAKPKAKPKKVLTEEQAAKKKERAAKAEIKELKKTALTAPKKPRQSAWTAYVKENVKKGTPVSETQQQLKGLAQEFKQLSPSDREHYNQLARQSTEAANAAYRQWVESHSEEQINKANAARRALLRKIPDAKPSRFPKIEDARAAKRPLTPYVTYFVERNASGDFQGIAVAERGKLIGQEWKNMSQGDKQRYTDMAGDAQNRTQQANGGIYAQQAAAGAA